MAEAESTEAETPPDIEMWDWETGETIHVDVPASEQPEPARDERTPRFRPRASASAIIPSLNGKSLEAVQEEANRIKLGEYFSSFAEFDRCLHSWCVLNGRGAHRFKTHAKQCVRTCRFGKCRIPWRPRQSPAQGQNENHPSSGPIHDPPDLNETPLLEEPDLGWHFQDGDWTLTECDPGVAVINPEVVAMNPEVTAINPEAATRPAIVTNARAPLASIVQNTLGRPSAGMHVNQNQMSTQGQALNKAPPSIVQHTSVWLPGSQSRRGTTQVSKATRKQSETGACGQLGRFQPLAQELNSGQLARVEPSSQEPNNNLPEDIPCPFRVRCQRKTKTGSCHITVCHLEHTCPQVKHKWRGPTKKAHWLGETLAPRVTRNVKVPVKELLDGFQADYYKSTSYHQMWRSKDLVRDWYLGGQRKSFHQIPSLLRRLTEVDAGCITDWSTEQNSDVFRRAFICPSATRAALQFCQPVVSLDACHTKNRKFPTQLFLATILDGNSQVVILCYAVAPVENLENWSWFLEQLDMAIHGVADPQIAFMSDRQKGLVAAVKKVFPGKVHAACANHLRANVKTNYGKAAAQFFSGCVYANTKKL